MYTFYAATVQLRRTPPRGNNSTVTVFCAGIARLVIWVDLFVVENFQHSTDVLRTFMGHSKDVRIY